MKVLPIQHYETKTWLLNRHYAKRIPSISYAFGLYDDNNDFLVYSNVGDGKLGSVLTTFEVTSSIGIVTITT